MTPRPPAPTLFPYTTLFRSVRVLQLLAIVVDQVGGLFGVSHGLEPALADLQGHDRGELELALADEARRPAQDREPVAPRPPRPVTLRRPRGGHGASHLLRSRGGEPPEHHAGVDRRGVHA